jgi:hypothetical protein
MNGRVFYQAPEMPTFTFEVLRSKITPAGCDGFAHGIDVVFDAIAFQIGKHRQGIDTVGVDAQRPVAQLGSPFVILSNQVHRVPHQLLGLITWRMFGIEDHAVILSDVSREHNSTDAM